MRTAKTRSDWPDAQADLSLRWAHIHFVGFVMSRLICADECVKRDVFTRITGKKVSRLEMTLCDFWFMGTFIPAS